MTGGGRGESTVSQFRTCLRSAFPIAPTAHLYLRVSYCKSAHIEPGTRSTGEDPGLHEAGPAEGCPTQAEREWHVDSRRCFLRSQRARRLRPGRGIAPEGKA